MRRASKETAQEPDNIYLKKNENEKYFMKRGDETISHSPVKFLKVLKIQTIT